MESRCWWHISFPVPGDRFPVREHELPAVSGGCAPRDSAFRTQAGAASGAASVPAECAAGAGRRDLWSGNHGLCGSDPVRDFMEPVEKSTCAEGVMWISGILRSGLKISD